MTTEPELCRGDQVVYCGDSPRWRGQAGEVLGSGEGPSTTLVRWEGDGRAPVSVPTALLQRVQRSRQRTMVKRVEWVRDLTVQELFDWCVQRGLPFDRVTITATHLKFETEQTPEEAERMAVAKADQEARQLRWERETYDRLQAKFEPPDQMGQGASYNTESFAAAERDLR